MGTLAVNGLTVRFGGLAAVRDVSFVAGTGRVLGLIGPNGAGKSTLLNCLSGITRPNAGSVRVDGTELAGLPAHRIASLGLARVFQHPELVGDFTVLQNLLLGCHRGLGYGLLAEMAALPRARRAEADARARALSALDAVGLAAASVTRVALLPYGHRKLVEVARAVLTEPRFILLDEPVAGLNAQEIERLAQLVLSLRAERDLGIILVEHNMGLVARLCDDVVVLDAGIAIASGPPAAVLRDPKVMAAYLGDDTVDEVRANA